MTNSLDEYELQEIRRGRDLHLQKKYIQAEAVYRSFLKKYPNNILGMHLLALLLCDIGRADESVPMLVDCLNAVPGDSLLHNNIAWAYLGLQQPFSSIYHARFALSVRPDYEKAWLCFAKSAFLIFRLYGPGANVSTLGDGFDGQDLISLCYGALDRVIGLNPANEEARAELASLRMYCCDWSEWSADWSFVKAVVASGTPVLSSFDLMAALDEPEIHLQCAKMIFDRFPKIEPCTLRYKKSDRIRVGYVSSDFHNHATSQLMVGVFENHDRNKFEIFGISIGDDFPDDPMRARLLMAFENFCDLRSKSVTDIAAWIREKNIDILVDLKGFTAQSRPGIFLSKPAPILIGYLGYPGSMGGDVFDYIVGDAWVTPFLNKKFFSEKIIQLPHSYQCNDDLRFIPEGVADRSFFYLPKNGIVFAAFNALYKINPSIFDVWMRLLLRVSNGVIWMICEDERIKANLRREAEAKGINSDRLIFSKKLPLNEHLKRHQAADIFLDTLPYNAHTTASDALWSGLPVLTCAGRAFAGRVGASLLDAVGLPELISNSLQEYEEKAVFYATNPEALLEIKNRLKSMRSSAPLFDTVRFTRNLESAYSAVFDRWSKGLPPREFSVMDFMVG